MKVDHQGRVTIPVDLRRYLDIEEGDDVFFSLHPHAEENGRALILWKREEDAKSIEAGEGGE